VEYLPDNAISFMDPGLLGLGDIAFLDMTASLDASIVCIGK